MVEAKNKESSHWWWFDSHNKGNSNRSPWLNSTLAELDEKTKRMLKVIEEDADSFAQRAEMYYKKRPELISMVEDFYRTHRSLAERFDQLKSEPSLCSRLSTTHSSLFPSPISSLTKYRLDKSLILNLNDKSYDSYSDAYGPEEEESDESEVDDPEEELEEEETIQDCVNSSETELIKVEEIKEEVVMLREEVERLRDENKVQQEKLMEKDEEKREVIRQLSLAMDLLREENVKLRQCRLAEKMSRVEQSKPKEGTFLGKLFNGFAKKSVNVVSL